MRADLYPDMVYHYLVLYFSRDWHELSEAGATREKFEFLRLTCTAAFVARPDVKSMINDALKKGWKPSQTAATLKPHFEFMLADAIMKQEITHEQH